MQPLRPYQVQAVSNVHTAWQNGHRRVLLVAPTGAGKTRLAEEIIWRARMAGETVVFVVHRRELLRQAADRLRKRFGRLDVGIIAPGEDFDPHAPIQVATVQTLLARKQRPQATLIVFDEAHHYVSDDWNKLVQYYTQSRALGLTATPERQDGKPLGDMFDTLVVAAKYSELVADGFLVPCRVYQPPQAMGADLALDPLEAYRRHGEETQAFGFAPNVKMAHELAARFTESGYPSKAIDGKMTKRDRDAAIDAFSRGELRVLWNFNVLTEGVDVPAARTVLMCRSFDHVGTYLQAAGRSLRPFEGKVDAIIIDLTGATLKHGMPTEDREYSLEDEGIRRTATTPLRNCLQCGATLHAGLMTCPECGYEFEKRDPRIPKIYSLELREVYAGAQTPEDAQRREYERLRQVAKERGWSIYFVQKSFKQLFGKMPVIYDASEEEKRAELTRLKKVAAEKGFKPGFAMVRFKEMFGAWPPRGW